jgi:hypothetical protein
MAMWKHYIVLFGGFYDPGIQSECSAFYVVGLSYVAAVAKYLNDLWLFDTQEYTWKQAVFKDNERKPS